VPGENVVRKSQCKSTERGHFQILNEILHEISNDNTVRVVKFTTSEKLSFKNKTFPHCKHS
jgi:hypothetical protein